MEWDFNEMFGKNPSRTGIMMSKSSSSGSIKGYLDVKIPSRKRKSISLFRVQVWKRRCWVVVRGDRSPAEVGTTTGVRSDQVNLSVEIYSQHEGSSINPTEGTILHLDSVHSIRRTKSKSHPYAFEVCGRRGEAFLYLSGGSESESQRWMGGVRTILWPPLHRAAILKAYPNCWEVSSVSVGDAGSAWGALRGVYGLLTVSDGSLLLKDLHNGTTKVSWPLVSLQKIYVASGGALEDEGKIFIVQTRQSHPCGEAFLYFFCQDLSELLEGLHQAVSTLINKNKGDDASILSDLSELSEALHSVVVLPQIIQESSIIRKSTSVLDLSLISANNSLIGSRLSISQNNLLEGDSEFPSSATNLTSRILGHFRRKSMSEANLTKVCLDETDEELDCREDDLEESDLRPSDLPKDRTSSSGSYNSYRSNDSGVKLSASPSTYGECTRLMIENAARRLVSKSDSLDSCSKEETKGSGADENHKSEFTRKMRGDLEEEPDVETKVGAWRIQSAKGAWRIQSAKGAWRIQSAKGAWRIQSAKRPTLLKNLTISANPEVKSKKNLSRTMSESYKEVVDRKNDKDNPFSTRHTKVYEEIVDVLRPITEKKLDRENEYEELEKCRNDTNRPYSYQDPSQAPPLPPRRPQAHSPDPWMEQKSGTMSALKKLLGLSLYNKSHSTDSMLEADERFLPAPLGSDDMATVQALGTLPRIKRRTFERHEASLAYDGSPKITLKQRLTNSYGISPNRSPKIPRPKNLLVFKQPSNDEPISPNTEAALKLHKQLSMQVLRSPSPDVLSPDSPNHSAYQKRIQDDSKDPLIFLKSPKIVAKTFNFLRKFPRDNSLESKRKSAIYLPTVALSDPGKVPNSFSLDSFAVEEGQPERKETSEVRPRAMSFAPSSPATQICRRNCCYEAGISPTGTPATSFPPSGGLSRTSVASWREGCRLPPPALPASCEHPYANLGPDLGPDPEYMTVEELRSTFTKKGTADDGGYLSMGDLRTSGSRGSEDVGGCHPYLSICEAKNSLKEEFSVVCHNEDSSHRRSDYSHDPLPRHSNFPLGHSRRTFSFNLEEELHCSSSCKSAPSSRKASCCDASDYLTPQEVSRLLRRELVFARGRLFPVDLHHHHPLQHYHHYHHH